MLMQQRHFRSSSSKPIRLKGIPLRQALTSRRSRARPLPQELIDHIIDCLKDQRDALIACSSVSRAFVRRTQQHLFAKTILFPSLEKKLTALLERSPHLAAYSKELVIAINTSKTISLGDATTEEQPLFKTSQCLPSSKATSTPFFLRDVHRFGFWYSEGRRAWCLMMVGEGENSFLSIMNSCSLTRPAFALDKLQWLGLRELPGPWIDAFQELAKTSLTRLKHLVIELEIKPGQTTRPVPRKEPIDLSHLKSLSTIELRNNTYDHDRLIWQTICAILRSLPKPSELTQLTFYCPGRQFARHMTPSHQSHWEDVDLVLSYVQHPASHRCILSSD
ncbi:hypothetical protein BDZ97DRAFT_2055285 [Flammula alnicola]|nr:hypothetical protein BDZ97DRAFT_2055285 [Flammula alnicola]